MKIRVVFVDLYNKLSLHDDDFYVPISNIGFLYGPLMDYKNMRL